MCIYGCKNANTYNLVGLKAEYCNTHKTSEMVNTKHELCAVCNTQASYGYLDDNKRISCVIHKLDGMINLKNKNIRCKDTTCLGNNNKVDGYCSVKCYISNNLDNLENINDYLISLKEFLVYKYLSSNFTKKIIWDKLIKGCNYRPDFLMKFDNFNIIIEVDQHQHKDYDKNNELKRIQTIHTCLNTPLFVIRLNTDSYDNNQSCFNNTSLRNIDDWNNRLQKLNTTINECINREQNELCELDIIYLFYDSSI